MRHKTILSFFVCGAMATLALPSMAEQATGQCQRQISADVVVLDQPFMFNRLGTAQPQGMIFALKRDVVPTNTEQKTNCELFNCSAGNVMLRSSKRPRPFVLRMNVSDCLQVNFTNLLNPIPENALQPTTREAGVHAMGMQLIGNINADGSWVGANVSSLASPVAPGNTATYRFYAGAEGTYLLYSTAADFAGTDPNPGGQLTAGLFGAVNVQVTNAEWYRSQMTQADLTQASQGTTPDGHPKIKYDAVYPAGSTWPDGTPIPPGTPVLNMLDANNEIVYSDLTAIITGPNAGRFPDHQNAPEFYKNPSSPDRRQPYREFTLFYHDALSAVQAFPDFYSNEMGNVLSSVTDNFAINYGMDGIGAEILANRIGVGPMGPCTDCKFEEFFLSSWAVGDPAMVVDVPANAPQPPIPWQQQTQNISQYDENILNWQNMKPPPPPPPPPSPPSVQEGARDPPTGPYRLEPVIKATKALYPDDPSNVYHSYMRDHVKFRILHAGTSVTHVHHVHAHQWLHSPNSDNSQYLDSQMINPGATFTLEMVFNGSGNLNQTVGDSIFHCHFYPHFAAGMWALWRVHDTFESGTELDSNGRPVAGTWNRALPDGEIATGTPTPAVVPLPTLAMAPMPARVQIVPVHPPGNPTAIVGYQAVVNPDDLKVGKNPGFPFFIPGVAGHRPSHPPIDFAKNPTTGQALDGGLPRHMIVDGTIGNEHHNQWDFSKDPNTLVAISLPEQGTEVEKVAMATHATRAHPSYTPEGQPGSFILNGLPPAPGAPYAEPGIDLEGKPVGNIRRYKAANIQLDVVFNKKGWHYPQQRLISLWEDVQPTLQDQRAPEPLFFRANTDDVVEFWHTNLVPDYYELDDFQVRTPTDILGQHIHLVKFDVTASDGAANGFNYEDGSLSPQEVQDRIASINLVGGLYTLQNGTITQQKLTPQAPYYFCDDRNKNQSWYNQYCNTSGGQPLGEWVGAQTTIQRWYADPVLNNQGEDRTLRTVFTHDHFSPSTHQQIGVYAGLLTEPEGSQWRIPAYLNPQTGTFETNVPMYTRDDGGPTSWSADIITKDPADSYREFALEFQDLSLVYNNLSAAQPKPYNPDYLVDSGGNIIPCTSTTPPSQCTQPWGWVDPNNAINAPTAPYPTPPQPVLVTYPQTISSSLYGMASVNYRNEPLPFRVWDPINKKQPAGVQGDLSHAFRSIARADQALNQQPAPGTPTNPANPNGFKFPPYLVPTVSGVEPCDPASSTFQVSKAQPCDPFTPLLRAYENDKVQIRTLVGAHMLPHFFTLQGLKWLFEPSYSGSGYVAAQGMGISEHFEMLFTLPPTPSNQPPFADYLYIPGSGQTDLQQGLWGILRAYDGQAGQQEGLPFLPNNPTGSAPLKATGGCPASAPQRSYDITATTAAQALPPLSGQSPGVLLYNDRGTGGGTTPNPIYDPDALLYVLTQDLDAYGKLKPGVPIEPLILRAAAGDCLAVTLRNAFNPSAQDANRQPIFGAETTNVLGIGIDLFPSTEVGLRPQLVSYDITQNNGANIGYNPVQTVPTAPSGQPPNRRTYAWYAGDLQINPDGSVTGIPVEFGAINLMPSDPLEQDPRGLVGALIIEPQGSSWCEDVNSRASVSVYLGQVNCDDQNSRNSVESFREFVAIMQNDVTAHYILGTKTNSVSRAINYRSEPMPYRYNGTYPSDISGALSDTLVSADPQTPVFAAVAGTPVRFRLLHPGGNGDGQNVTIHGHVWQEEPYLNNSTVIGNNPLSQWLGSVNLGPGNAFTAVLEQAGGESGVPGDYLYRTFIVGDFTKGMWGILRVTSSDGVVITRYGPCPDQPKKHCVIGVNTVNPRTGQFAKTVSLFSGKDTTGPLLGTAPVGENGKWAFVIDKTQPPSITAKSSEGGVAVASLAPAPRPALRLAVPPKAAAPGEQLLRKKIEERVQSLKFPERE